MIKIGDFSKLSRISIRMLRHYDDMSLLKPVKVDGFTSYRFYDPAQLQMANRITALKDMGFSLASIANILKQYDDPETLKTFLSIKMDEIREQERETKNKLMLIEAAIKRLGKDGQAMKYDVTLKTLPQREVASLRKIIPSYDREGDLWRQMEQETGETLQMETPCYPIAVFHDEDFKNKDVDVEIQISVKKILSDTENVVFKTAESVQIASAVHRGGFELINEVNESVADWISDNGYELDGAMFNIYHVSPAQDQNPDNWVTEVCYPVKRKTG